MRTIQGIPVNPRLPKGFFAMDHARRPASHEPWWYRPFIRSSAHEAWPEGVRFAVYCLDGGAWDRPTARGWFGTLEEALRCALGLRTAVLEEFGTWSPLEGLED
jgi:hypothetical protein